MTENKFSGLDHLAIVIGSVLLMTAGYFGGVFVGYKSLIPSKLILYEKNDQRIIRSDFNRYYIEDSNNIFIPFEKYKEKRGQEFTSKIDSDLELKIDELKER